MEALQSFPRPLSSASSRSSSESRYKSPLSTSASIDYDYSSSRTSFESSYSDSSVKAVPDTTKAAVPLSTDRGRPPLVEPTVSSYLSYGTAVNGRQQVQTTLNIPQRLGKGPSGSMKGAQYLPQSPGYGFKKLPDEILLVILAELKRLHLEVGSLSCATCSMRGLVNVGASCRKWWGAARCILYEDIQLIGGDSTQRIKKKHKIKYGTRLILLRRTLRARPDLAAYVKSLKVPTIPDAVKGKMEHEKYYNLVASLIMACPNLERLPGFYPAYDRTFSRLFHALSTRSKLKEAVWIINPSPFQRQCRYDLTDGVRTTIPDHAPERLLPEQCLDFLAYHSKWTHLKTLFLHCNRGGTLDSLLFADICDRLPSLEQLHVSAFPAPAFNDVTLASLPPLKSLRLDNLPGITANGLSTYASLPSSFGLQALSLISLPLLSLDVLARVFSHLCNLTRFTLSQAPSPGLTPGTEIYLYPYLASSSLEYLHWEITDPKYDRATEILAKSMQYAGFPALRIIRAPTDFDGVLQKLCKPRQKIELSGDRYRNLGVRGQSGMPISQSMLSIASSTRSTFSLSHGRSDSIKSALDKSPTRSTYSSHPDHICSDDGSFDTCDKGMSLVIARRIAQHRIDTAVSQPQFHIIIWDEENQLVERHTVGGYVGLVQSRVFYSLKPDIDGTDESVVSIDGIGGLLDGGEETNVRDGCTGSWNLHIAVQGKSGKSGNGKDKWWHTERGRWKILPLEKFF